MYAVFTLTTGSVVILAIFANAAFFIKCMSVNMSGSVHAIFQCLGSMGILNMFVAGFILRRKIADCIERLKIIYNECKIRSLMTKRKHVTKYQSNSVSNVFISDANENAFLFLAQANNKSELVWQIFSKIVIGASVNNLALSFVSIFICWAKHHNFDVQQMYHPYKYMWAMKFWSLGISSTKRHFFCFSLPWNQQTLLGYFAETGFFALGAFASVLYFSCYIVFYISFCFHHQAFYKIFQYHVNKLTDSQQNSSNNKKIIHKLIHFHSSIKEWVQLKHFRK